MKRFPFIIVMLLLLGFCLNAQNIECIGNNIKISLHGYQEGDIQWQFSKDLSEWIDLYGKTSSDLLYTITETGYYRAKIHNNLCIIFSDTTYIEAYHYPSQANAGPDQLIESLDTLIHLSANNPIYGKGIWRIVAGDGGDFSDPNSPFSEFTGKPDEEYILKWTVSTECDSTTDDMLVRFSPDPTKANAGHDQVLETPTPSIILNANTPIVGKGFWSIISGAGGIIQNPDSPLTTFTGKQCKEYLLCWTISTRFKKSIDTLVVNFIFHPQIANAGEDTLIDRADSALAILYAQPSDIGNGHWTIISGGSGYFSSDTMPNSSFIGNVCTKYILRWTIPTYCGISSDDVSIQFDSKPTIANAGLYYGTGFQDTTYILTANTPSIGIGNWFIIKGYEGSFSDINNPNAKFTGRACNEYELGWKISTVCRASIDTVQIRFFATAIPLAGADQTINTQDSVISLSANQPHAGAGKWSIISGINGSFENNDDPLTKFKGLQCTSYTLRWTVTTQCESRFDDVNVNFYATPSLAISGLKPNLISEDTIMPLHAIAPQIGVGQWRIISGHEGIIEDVFNPVSKFRGKMDSLYRLVWTVRTACKSNSDTGTIFFNKKDITYNGYNYKLVLINDQVWFSENLKTTTLNDGQEILSSNYCWYKNNETAYKNLYGALYNWHIVNSNKLCPYGYHVPTDSDWAELAQFLGGEGTLSLIGNAAGKLKEAGTMYWLSPNIGATNEYGFNAMPGGYLVGSSFAPQGTSAAFWSATERLDDQQRAWYRQLMYYNSGMYRGDSSKDSFFSVRCLRN